MIYGRKSQLDYLPTQQLEIAYSFQGPYGVSFDSYMQNLAVQATKRARKLLCNCPLLPSYEKRSTQLMNRVPYLPLGAYLCEAPESVALSFGIGNEMSTYDGSSFDRDPLRPDRLINAWAGPGLYFTTGIWALLDWRFEPDTCILDGAVLKGETTAKKTTDTDQFQAGDVLYDKTSGGYAIVSSNDGTDIVFDAWGAASKDIADEAVLYRYGSLDSRIEDMVIMDTYLSAFLQINGGHSSGFESERADLHSYKRRSGSGSVADSYAVQLETLKSEVLCLRPEGRPI